MSDEFGEDIIRKFDADETARRRLDYIRESAVPVVQKAFEAVPGFESVVLIVAQYWCDEAEDAVHSALVFSVSRDPDLKLIDALREGYAAQSDNHDYDGHAIEILEGEAAAARLKPQIDAWLKAKPKKQGFAESFLNKKPAFSFDFEAWGKTNVTNWGSNSEAIPLFAAYCPEGGHQEGFPLEFYAPCAILRRASGGVEIEVLTHQARPWLEGVAPEWDEEEEE